MKIVGLTLLAIAALAAPGMAQAQVRGGQQIGNGGAFPLPQDIRPMGMQMQRYQSGEYTAHFEADQCKSFGCLIIVNKSATFEVSEFYVNDGVVDSHGVPDWGANQFKGFSLEPSRAVWTVKPPKMKCEMVVRIVLTNPATKQQVERIEPVNMCNMPKGGFAVLGVQADGARVILEDGN